MFGRKMRFKVYVTGEENILRAEKILKSNYSIKIEDVRILVDNVKNISGVLLCKAPERKYKKFIKGNNEFNVQHIKILL